MLRHLRAFVLAALSARARGMGVRLADRKDGGKG